MTLQVTKMEVCPPIAPLVSLVASGLFPGNPSNTLRSNAVIIPGGWCTPDVPGHGGGGLCWSSAFELLDMFYFLKDAISLVYSPIVSNALAYMVNCTIVCNQVCSLPLLEILRKNE